MAGMRTIADQLADLQLDGAEILNSVEAFLSRFVCYPNEQARVAHVLWIGHAHLMDRWECTPRLAFLSPEAACGKSRALEITELLVPRPVVAVNATPAYLFRKVSDPEGLPTILFDEIDTVFGPKAKENEEVRGIINAGHRKGAMAGRCVIRGREVMTEELPAYCAIAVAGIGSLPDTILTRSVIVRMRRRSPAEEVQAYRRRLHAPEGAAIKLKLEAWSNVIAPTIGETFPEMPEGVEDRNADCWEPLLSVADLAGKAWPDRARVAAVALVADLAGGMAASLGVRLLSDLYPLFANRLSVSTEELISSLCRLEEAPWSDLRGRPIDARKLANLLRPYGVHSRSIRDGTAIVRGYYVEDLSDAWVRYAPAQPAKSATAATTATAAQVSP
jgi:hypothetical protein